LSVERWTFAFVLNLRPAAEADRDAIWNIFHNVIAAGDTYVFDPKTSREEALAYWFRDDTHTYVAVLAKGRVRPIGGQDREPVGEAVSFPGTATPSPTAADLQEPVLSASRTDREVVGSYILKPNQVGLGAHVSNASFIVAPAARGRGVGRAMGEHCLKEARRLGFRAMQFNFVVSTNESAVHLWQELGFKIVGTLPGAFRHSQKGYVDVYVMFRSLIEL
jgi:L-amino acid N-acyltransferase YncA